MKKNKIMLGVLLGLGLLLPQVGQAATEIVEYQGEKIEITIPPDEVEVPTPVIDETLQHDLGSSAEMLIQEKIPRSVIFAGEPNRPAADFIDISSHNGALSVEDFKAMQKYGVHGVCVKLTEGTTYVNPYAKMQISNAIAAGMNVSAYHYSWFTTKAQAEAEADFFAKTAFSMGLDTNTLMVNDAENPVMNNGFTTENSLYFALRLIDHFGFNRVVHYSFANWFTTGVLNPTTLKPDSLWVAHYVNNPNKENLLYTNNAAWQWSSEFVFPEIPNKRFDISMDYSGWFDDEPDSGFVKVYRAYNANSGEHLYTLNRYEYNHLIQVGWYAEGVAWKSPLEGQAVYRLYNPNTGEHFYTMNKVEYELTAKKGWKQEGVAFHSNGFGMPVYRLFNPKAKGPGSHHFTLNTYEVDSLVDAGWKYEGVAFYGVKN